MYYNPLRVQKTVLPNGERFPILLCRETGIPSFYPNTYLLNNLRGRSKQATTMKNAGEAIKALWLWAALDKIDIVGRMLTCEPLTAGEMDSLVQHLRLKQRYLQEWFDEKKSIRNAPQRRRVTSIGTRRSAKQAAALKENRVKGTTTSNRMVYVVGFIEYMKNIGLKSVPRGKTRWDAREEMNEMIESLKERAPKDRDEGEYKRQGLTCASQEILWEVTDPNSPRNPWRKDCRLRNRLIVEILWGIGIRAGELLNMEVEDIDLQAGTIRIKRLPDNPDDPRTDEPNVKTRARTLYVGDDLLETIEDYLIDDRDRFVKANKHNFLIVSEEDGAPLSRAALSKIFARGLKKIDGLPVDISPHAARHTWNDNFSDFCDEKEVPEEKEKTIRCQAMGWVKNSEQVLTYTRRHTAKMAVKYQLGTQKMVTERFKKGFIGAIDIRSLGRDED